MVGAIDKLVIGPNHVLVVDFKSNITVPDTADQVPEGLLRQLGAYGAACAQIFPDREVQTAILWTRTGRLMPLAHDIVRRALAATPSP